MCRRLSGQGHALGCVSWCFDFQRSLVPVTAPPKSTSNCNGVLAAMSTEIANNSRSAPATRTLNAARPRHGILQPPSWCDDAHRCKHCLQWDSSDPTASVDGKAPQHCVAVQMRQLDLCHRRRRANKTTVDATAWLAESISGYCGVTTDGKSDCMHGDKGSWPLRSLVSKSIDESAPAYALHARARASVHALDAHDATQFPSPFDGPTVLGFPIASRRTCITTFRASFLAMCERPHQHAPSRMSSPLNCPHDA